ncbi:MAG TPA: PilZ domain-containing protein, partial [Candidatus Sulfotelmatobacter sp.]|nr:PilZ domain-containing protein [Candidatus Sulfotelmatobacter sp.]
IVDWREIDSLGEFVSAVRRSKLNADCVLVAIVRDLLDMWQAFAAGVLRDRGAAAQATPGASQHCGCDQHTRLSVCRDDGGESERGGAGLRMAFDAELGAHLSVADEVELRFTLPGTDDMLQFSGTVVWTTSAHCGVKFGHIPDAERLMLEQWLTVCVERSLAEVCGRLRAGCA